MVGFGSNQMRHCLFLSMCTYRLAADDAYITLNSHHIYHRRSSRCDITTLNSHLPRTFPRRSCCLAATRLTQTLPQPRRHSVASAEVCQWMCHFRGAQKG